MEVVVGKQPKLSIRCQGREKWLDHFGNFRQVLTRWKYTCCMTQRYPSGIYPGCRKSLSTKVWLKNVCSSFSHDPKGCKQSKYPPVGNRFLNIWCNHTRAALSDKKGDDSDSQRQRYPRTLRRLKDTRTGQCVLPCSLHKEGEEWTIRVDRNEKRGCLGGVGVHPW